MSVPRFFTTLAFLGAAAAGFAAPAIKTTWGARAGIDTNVFLQSAAPLIAGQPQAALPANASSLFASANASVAATWGDPKTERTFSLSYAPEIVRYERFGAENHTDHRAAFDASARFGDWRFETKNSALFVDGSEESPVFNRQGGTPAIGGEPVRARRTQDIAKSSLRITRTFTRGFVRGAWAFNGQDFHTRESATTCYTNYVDRDESAGGVDAGFNVQPKLALVAGVRRGHQHQANLLGAALNYSNTFTRWLAGVEGSPAPAIKLSLLAGPDERKFGGAVRNGFERDQHTTYSEATAAWTPGKADTIAFSAKRYLWLSSGGRGAYVDTLYDVSWKRRIDAAWSATLGANYHTGYAGRFNPTSPRHDLIYTTSASVIRLVGGTKLEASLLHDWSETVVPNTSGRKYHRWLASLGVTRMW